MIFFLYNIHKYCIINPTILLLRGCEAWRRAHGTQHHLKISGNRVYSNKFLKYVNEIPAPNQAIYA